MAEKSSQLVLRNYTEVKRIEKRLHSIGDWVLPFAIPYRGLVLFVVIGVPTWLVLNLVDVPLTLDQLYLWIGIPGIGASLAYTLRIQGKSLPAVLDAQVRHSLWWLRHRNNSRPHEYMFLAVIWRADHPAYRAVTNSPAA